MDILANIRVKNVVIEDDNLVVEIMDGRKPSRQYKKF